MNKYTKTTDYEIKMESETLDRDDCINLATEKDL